MKRITNFVKNTFKNIPKEGKEEIIKKVIEQLVEKVEDLVEKGLDINEAIDKTVTEFGTLEDYFLNYENQTKIIKVKRRKTLIHYRNDLLFSAVGSVIIIGILLYINLVYFPGNYWFVVPAIAILWWPLAIGYNLLNKRESRRDDENE